MKRYFSKEDIQMASRNAKMKMFNILAISEMKF